MFGQNASRVQAMPDSFIELCDSLSVVVSMKPFPNPGDPYHAMKLLEFKNHGKIVIDVQELEGKKKHHIIPTNGTLQIMIGPFDRYPTLKRQAY